jgi:hypothetical protein
MSAIRITASTAVVLVPVMVVADLPWVDDREMLKSFDQHKHHINMIKKNGPTLSSGEELELCY